MFHNDFQVVYNSCRYIYAVCSNAVSVEIAQKFYAVLNYFSDQREYMYTEGDYLIFYSCN